MRKALKWIGIVLGVLVGLIFIFVVFMFSMGTSRLNKSYSVEPAPVSIPEDAAAIERGEYLYATSCSGCHGEDLEGKAVLDDPVLGYFPASNLTNGQGGIGNYTETDLVRAIRHGVGADGKPLMIMPAKAYWYFSDQDLGAILALIAQGLTNTAIAERLVLSPKTVRNHVSNIFSKLQVADRAQAIIQAREAGMGKKD